jgi:TolB-like protein
MSSIIPGYNYDIFISYRQKDNKGDGWVTDFVSQLKGELEATFKEEISIYFDENPFDGVLETHNVDKSLEDKLKCLIFIPIISQTYCDPKSFAWKHEFCTFNKRAKEGKPGRDIKLANGNVASRILPVKIHELDQEDARLLEDEIGGALRAVEFIYKSFGVNRPLRSKEEKPENNLNNTLYRDQINKVANAVKEILNALKRQNQPSEKILQNVTTSLNNSHKSNKTSIILSSVVALAFIILGILFIPKLLKPSKEIEKSIAVLPFDNLNSDKEQAWFSDGITDVVINQLSKISDFRVIGRTSTLKYKQEKKSISEIGEELGVSHIIEGTVQLQENKMRISVQLIRVVNEDHIWSNIYDKEWKDIFDVQRDIAMAIAEELKTILTTREKAEIEKSQTSSPEAYNFYLQGRYFWYMRTEEGLRRSVEYFNKAIDIDTNYAVAYAGLADAYYIQAYWDWIPWTEGTDMAKETALKALTFDENLSEAHTVLGALLKSREWKWEEARRELLLAVDLNPEYATAYQYYSDLLDILRENKEARNQLNKALEIDPFLPLLHSISSRYYYNEGKLKEALNECQLVEELDAEYNDRGIYWREFYIYLKLQEELKAVSALEKALYSDTFDTEISNQVLDTYNKSGIKGIWTLLIESEIKKPVPNALRLANIYATLDDRRNALTWLEKAFEDPSAGYPRINNNPDFNNIRSEPRFQLIIREMGLSEYQEPK